MTAVCLNARSSLITQQWSNIFTGFNTDSKSCLFIKQLTNTCVSTILYLRKVLSDDYFETKSFEGLTLKLLKPGDREDYGSKIEQWLEGAFEAVEKKYLKRLMLDIQDAESNMTLEIYTMTFNYNKEKEAIYSLLSTTASNCDSFTMSNTKLNTIKLLQMCHAVTQSYSSLPPQVKISMRLSYYENTPKDYQPRGYMAWEPVEPKFPNRARSIEIGITSTEYHFFKLFNKSCLSDKFFKDMEDQSENSNSALPLRETSNSQIENAARDRQTKAKKELQFGNPKSTEASLLIKSETKMETTFLVTEKFTSLSSDKAEGNKILESKSRENTINVNNTTATKGMKIQNKRITKDISSQVRCACLSSDKTETMFPCLSCGFLVHSECYGILQFDSSKKIRFNCHLCHKAENKCHDKVLMGLKSSLDQQKLSVLRRVLRHCTTPRVYTITLKKIEKIAGATCQQNVVNAVLNKIIEIGLARAQAKKKSYLIDKKVLTNKLLDYFYKVQNSSRQPQE